MTDTQSITNEASFRTALSNGINLMLGAGFSLLAKDGSGRALPLGLTLARELREKFDVDREKDLNLMQVYSIISTTHREEVDAYLTERFTVDKFDSRYRILQRLAIRSIYTTNIDNLCHRIYENSLEHYLNDLTQRGPSYNDRAAIEYMALHGSVTNAESRYRFSTLEVASSFGTNPAAWYDFKRQLGRHPTLFWGYSVQDAAALEALQLGDIAGGTVGNNWIALLPSEEKTPIAEYFRALNFQLIFLDTSDLLDYLTANAHAPEPTRSNVEIDEALSQYQLPAPGTLAQRPLQDFYSGAAPAWSDIYREELHRLSHYRNAEDSINARRNVLLTGIPTSGKTTLLMQLAAAGVGSGITLMPQGLTKESAARILRLLNGADATVYVDNAADDIEAYAHLAAASNVIAVGAERDYHLSTVMHFLDDEKITFVDLSVVSEIDLGAIRARIPSSIRTSKMIRPETTRGRPSILEFTLANTTSKGLVLRLEDALREFQRDKPQLGEMLLMIAYVHACRTPVSLDMAIAYWRDELDDWQDLYEMVSQVGSILSEYEGDLREDAQDYFAARSQVVAEAALRAAGGGRLKRMLLRFHNNIAPVRVCRYDIFRRRAFASDLFLRAFPETEEAMSFYDDLFDRDPSPYLLQQKAVFLSRRGRYSESFVQIDRALSFSHGRNWTIQASHADILFQANIGLAAESTEARDQVDRAMALLEKCYASDRRKSIHALRFGDRALQYSNLFNDEQAIHYLTQAKQWLATAMRREPWLTRVEPLARQIDRRLG